MEAEKKISDSAVQRATGYTWRELFQLIADAEKKANVPQFSHKQIVSFLEKQCSLSPWWCQSVAVAYEKDSGRRQLGETEAAGFEIGAQKTVYASREQVWELLTGPVGMALWLGSGGESKLVPGEKYCTSEGTKGEIRVVKQMNHLRLSWQPADWTNSSTLQLRVISGSEDKTTISFHHEKLPDAAARERMKEHWKNVLEELQIMLPGFPQK